MKKLSLAASVMSSITSMFAMPSAKVYGFEPIRRMLQKHGRSQRQNYFDPRINRHTGKPHLHRREIARRTTVPGTPERRAAMEAAR